MIAEGFLLKSQKTLYLGIIVTVELISSKFRMLMFTNTPIPILLGNL